MAIKSGYRKKHMQAEVHYDLDFDEPFYQPKNKAPAPPRTYRGRMALIFFLLLLAVLTVIGKLLYIQTIDAERLQTKARQSRAQTLSLFNRGRILDKNGIVLAQDTFVYDVFAHPRFYWKATPAQIATAIAPVLNMDAKKLEITLSEPYSTIGIAKGLSKDTITRLLKARIPMLAINPKTKQPLLDDKGQPVIHNTPIPGLDFSKKPVRNYPQGDLAAHVLGYVNDEAGISSGIEYTARNILKKAPNDLGKAVLSGRGDIVQPEVLSPEALVTVPKAQDLTLTLDSHLQYIAEKELANGLARTHAKRGTVIMLNPKTGEILAFVSTPGYAPDLFYKASAEQLKNWAISDVYPPGSTFKILTVACGLESGAINRNTRLMDTGRMNIGGWKIQNYDYAKKGAPGMIDLVYLLEHSSNIGSAKISMMIPKDRHYQLIKGFGMGQPTSIDLPGESSGILHDANTWDISTHASIGYGYGLAATPIQMAAAVAAIANGGIWITPHLIPGRTDIQRRRVLSKATTEAMTNLLTESIRDAKTSTVRLDGIDVAGKTGTSRKPRADGRGYEDNVFTSFVGYYPARDPKALMMVVIDSPNMPEAWGSTVAGPIFHAIAEQSIGYLGLKPAHTDAAKIVKKPAST